jgi:hypothetical protein
MPRLSFGRRWLKGDHNLSTTMDNHTLLLASDALHSPSHFFDEEDAHGYLRDDSFSWFPDMQRSQDAVSLVNQAPLDYEPFSTDYLDVESSSHLAGSSLDGQLTKSTNSACGATPWSGYDTRMHWADWDTAGTKPPTDLLGFSTQAPSQWLADDGSVMFSDDICSVRTDGFGEHISGLPWNTTALPLATQGTHHPYLPFSTPTSCVDSYFNEPLFDWEDAHPRYNIMGSSASASYHNPRVNHDADADAVYTNASKEPPYICPEEDCSRHFLRQPDLSRHRRTMHEGSQRYRCAIEETA